MLINDLIKQKKLSKYKLSQNSGVPYTTIRDICSGKTQLEKSTAETIYKISKALDVSMEDLLEPYCSERMNFEQYKIRVCRKLKTLGDIEFIIETLKKDDICKYYEKDWLLECLYLLALLDYVSRINDIPICTKYNEMRKRKMKEKVYPESIIAIYNEEKDKKIKEDACKESIPEFIRFNIVENDVRNKK